MPDAQADEGAAGAGYSTATDLADWLVRELGLPFREAHHVTGRIVALASESKVGLEKLPLAAMQAVEPRIDDGVFAVLGVDKSVRSRIEPMAAPRRPMCGAGEALGQDRWPRRSARRRSLSEPRRERVAPAPIRMLRTRR